MADPSLATRVSSTPEALTVEWRSGAVSEFASLWLRDNVREDRDATSGQRLVDIVDLPAEAGLLRRALAERT